VSTSIGRKGHRIKLEGELDLARKNELQRLFNSLEKDGPLTIDLRRVTYADSTFLSLLASLALRFQEVPITLLGATPNLRKVFRVVQFDKLFQIVDDGQLD
jgi:anti-anti-sigma factor